MHRNITNKNAFQPEWEALFALGGDVRVRPYWLTSWSVGGSCFSRPWGRWIRFVWLFRLVPPEWDGFQVLPILRNKIANHNWTTALPSLLFQSRKYCHQATILDVHIQHWNMLEWSPFFYGEEVHIVFLCFKSLKSFRRVTKFSIQSQGIFCLWQQRSSEADGYFFI